MFQSSGYFRHIDCPFLISGLCERTHCQFRHSSDIRVNSFVSQYNDSNIAYNYNDGRLPCIENEDYTHIDCVNSEKPSYSPIVTIEKVVEEETILEEAYIAEELPAAESPPVIIKVSKSVSTQCIPMKEKFKKKSKKSNVEPIDVDDLKKRIFDSSSDDEIVFKGPKMKKQKIHTGKSHHHRVSTVEEVKRNAAEEARKAVEKARKSAENARKSVEDARKAEEEKEYLEMEEALVSGRMRGRRLATVDILRFRMMLAARDGIKLGPK